ncbi:hypothetical protein [Paenibacillus sp. HJGM_3]|uniref:hypothetical protein n=1 Tax=Paenibacillus sp. HJGM_3 TaxID=3379816 RepID=UPI00385B7906
MPTEWLLSEQQAEPDVDSPHLGRVRGGRAAGQIAQAGRLDALLATTPDEWGACCMIYLKSLAV